MEILHSPVLVDELLAHLIPPHENSLMLDCTLGEGGHAEVFLQRYPGLRYHGLDADSVIQEKARARLAEFGTRVNFQLGFYDELLAEFAQEATLAPDLILFDLGISMHHYFGAGRGFGFTKDEVLDMRLSPQNQAKSAFDFVNREKEIELARIFFEYGEERASRKIAKVIVESRRRSPIRTSGDLARVIESVLPRVGKTHPATRSFQALRIAVNDEFGRIERGLKAAATILKENGILGVISFHSLEDRIVKNIFKEFTKNATELGKNSPILEVENYRYELVVKKALEASAEEARKNPSARSAKLRLLRKIKA